MKPFCFYEWYWIRVCVPQFRYELSITRRWQEMGRVGSGDVLVLTR